MVRPIFFAIRTGQPNRQRHRIRRFPLILLCGFGLLAAGAVTAKSPPNAVPVTRQYEVPPQSDPFQRELIKQTARQNTERFRMRVTLPEAAFDGQAAGVSMMRPAGGSAEAEAEGIGPAGTSNYLMKLGWVLLGVVVWYLIARRLAPEVAESMMSWVRSRLLLPSTSTDQIVTMLVEEKAVLEFQAALRAGGNPSGTDAGEESADGNRDGGGVGATVAGFVRELRRLMEEAARSEDAAGRRKILVEALDRLHSLKNLATPSGLVPLKQMTCALEMLLKQLTEKTSNVTSSSLRTANLGVTLLEDLCQSGLDPDLLSQPPLRLLAVDDETFSRYALAHALKRGLNEPEVAENGEGALKLAARHTFDLIFLDVQMPGMDGFELCSKIHQTGPNRTTPVVFVTSLRDFDARASSVLCGGRDLIAKPFLTFELTVKALTLVAGERLRGRGRLAETTVVEPAQPETASVSLRETPVPTAPDRAEVPQVKIEPAIELPPPLLMPAAAPVEGDTTAGFFDKARAQISKARNLVERIRKTPDPRVQQEMITDLFVKIHSLTISAENAGQHSIALTASTLEGLLKKLLQNVKHLSAPTLQTVAATTDLIQDLCAGETRSDLATEPPIRALVVDDDPVALRAASSALQLTFSKPESACDGKSALALAEEKSFDVIFLDVQMPDTDGFGVCAKIRETAINRLTPVVFVTSYDAAAVRAMSELCGGNNFLTKPCLSREMTLTALVYAIRGRLESSQRSGENGSPSGNKRTENNVAGLVEAA